MNIAQTIRNAGSHGAHRPFHKAHMTKQPVKPTDPDTLQICSDPMPKHRASAVNKYEKTFAAMKMGQSVKCKPNETGRISGAMRNYIKAKKLNAICKTMKTYDDGMGRVWMLENVAGKKAP